MFENYSKVNFGIKNEPDILSTSPIAAAFVVLDLPLVIL